MILSNNSHSNFFPELRQGVPTLIRFGLSRWEKALHPYNATEILVSLPMTSSTRKAQRLFGCYHIYVKLFLTCLSRFLSEPVLHQGSSPGCNIGYLQVLVLQLITFLYSQDYINKLEHDYYVVIIIFWYKVIDNNTIYFIMKCIREVIIMTVQKCYQLEHKDL